MEFNENREVMVNRELSWLQFNERVLEEAEDERVPLCERLSFLSIYQSNLDEYLMVRMGALVDQNQSAPKQRDNKTNLTAKKQIDAVLERISQLNIRKEALYANLMDELDKNGVRIVDFRRIGRQESERLERYFDSQIAPLITPILIEPRQPFPFLRGREIYAVVELVRKNGKARLGVIPCNSSVIPRLIEVASGEKKFMLAEELILHFIYKMFPGYFVKSKSLLRVIRNADIDADALFDEESDYREFMSKLIKRRKKLSPVRLELSRHMDTKTVEALCKALKCKRRFVVQMNTPLDVSFLFKIQDELRQNPQLFYERRIPQRPAWAEPGQRVLDLVRKEDRLLSYPFESMRPFLDMLQEAAEDERVVSIKMTLYRVAKMSKVVECLIEAAENGKQVVVLVELKARFDEENNIEWSRRLEEAGCTVIYGLEGYKVHSKLCLITRIEDDHTFYYTQVGTGNYNEKTARQYTDLSLLTANQKIGAEVADVFNALSMGDLVETSDMLMVAPLCLQNRILDAINEEIARALSGEEAYVGIKINSMTDRDIMDKLVEASRAGVHIDLLVRGICCLIPGVPGYTENITVTSIVGRFLEHSRIYIFGCGERRKIYIASADLMTRNTLRRVEVAVPILDEGIKAQIQEMFEILLADNVQARRMNSDGHYVRLYPEEGQTPVSSQEIFYQRAYDRAKEKAAGSEARP